MRQRDSLQEAQPHASAVFPSHRAPRPDSTWAASVVAATVSKEARSVLSKLPFFISKQTFGTAAWKCSPVTVFVPETWNRARMFTTPGRTADVWGVNVILSSFFSYAVYDVNRGAVEGCCCASGVWVCRGDCTCVWNSETAGDGADGPGTGAGEAGLGEASNNPRMSCILLFCGCGEMDGVG